MITVFGPALIETRLNLVVENGGDRAQLARHGSAGPEERPDRRPDGVQPAGADDDRAGRAAAEPARGCSHAVLRQRQFRHRGGLAPARAAAAARERRRPGADRARVSAGGRPCPRHGAAGRRSGRRPGARDAGPGVARRGRRADQRPDRGQRGVRPGIPADAARSCRRRGPDRASGHSAAAGQGRRRRVSARPSATTARRSLSRT